MTVCLDHLFREAKDRFGAWSHDDVRKVLEVLAGQAFQVDWEPGDEEWGRVVDTSGKVHVLVCSRIPLCIGLQDRDGGRLATRVSWMTVSSMSEPAFEVDRRLLEEIFERSLSENINYAKLSINDLWWATVS